MARLSLRLFGPFVATLDGDPVLSFGTEKARALLAYLAVEPPRPHSRPALTALLWPDQPEERARQNLRQALLHLRQVLGEPLTRPSFLLSTRETIQFDPHGELALDVVEFTSRIAACQSHHHRCLATCRPCLQRLREAVELYQGDFLQYLPLPDSETFQEWALLKREWLHQGALEALAVLASYHEQRGEISLARQYAHRQVELEPWNEEAHQRLMRLLALEGERSAALAQYEACRQTLATELAVEPDRATTALYERIRAGETLPLVAPPCCLPPAPTSFVGREQELAELAEQLAQPECHLLTLVGPGGIGKTRLALQAAAEQRGAYGDGIYFAPLAAVTSPEGVPPAIVEALHFSFQGREPPDQQLLQSLRSKELLLVLDNLEHLLESSAFLSAVLQQAPGVVLLVTSRERLDLREEWVYEVAGLAYPAAGAGPAGGSAVDLFLQRAAQVQRKLRLEDEPASIVQICRLVDGMPLAIELAASWVPWHSCAAIAAELAHSLDILSTTLRNVPERHRSMRAALEHSWNLLSDDERRAFARLSVFRGGFTAEAGREVAGAAPDTLEGLVSKSLLRRVEDRFDIHELLRQYGAEKLAQQPGRLAQANDLHSRYYAGWMHDNEGALHGPAAAHTMQQVWTELENLRAAWRWALEERRWPEIDQALGGLAHFYRLHGPLDEGEGLIGAALLRAGMPEEDAAGRPAGPLLCSRLFATRADLLYAQGHFEEAAAAAAEAVRRAAAVPGIDQAADRAAASGHLYAGQALALLGQHETAQRHLEEALRLARQSQAHSLEAESHRALGALAFRQGRYDLAQAGYEQTLLLFRSQGDRRGESWALNDLAGVQVRRGDYAAAGPLYEQVAQIGGELGDRHGRAIALANLGTILVYAGAYGRARTCLAQAADLFREVGDGAHEGTTLANLGWVLFNILGHPSGRHHLERAETLMRAAGLRAGERLQLAFMAQGCYRTGQLDLARRYVEQELTLLEEGSPPDDRGNVLTRLGHILAALGQLQPAAEYYQQALVIWDQLREPRLAMDALAGLAWVHARRGQMGRAVPLVEQLLPLLERYAATDEWPFLAYMFGYEVLLVSGDPRASAVLESAHTLLQEKASRIDEENLRRSFLENIVVHRQIAAAWAGQHA